MKRRIFSILIVMLSVVSGTRAWGFGFGGVPPDSGSSSGSSGSGGSGSGGRYPFGVQVDAGVGEGYSAIQNPDNTTAYYQTVALEGRGHIVLIGNSSSPLGCDLVGGIRYLDLRNTAQTTNEKEVANLIGPTVGVHFRLFKLIGGYQVDYLLARHYSVGPVSHELDYSMVTNHTYFGLQYTLGQLSLGLTYSTSQGIVPHASTGLSVDSAYNDQIYWLNLNYSFGTSFMSFMKALF